MNSNNIIISGLGISGLITASLFCKEKLNVHCFEPSDFSKLSEDQRTTAFLNPAINAFKEIGIWRDIEPFAQPLKEMEIIDAAEFKKNGETTSVVFDPNEISLKGFGYNIPNNKVSLTLLNFLRKKNNFVLHNEDSVVYHYAFDKNIHVKSTKGKVLEGQLLISCEGRDSKIRKREKMRSFKISYNQLAMVFQVSHSENHKDRTTEILDKGGPFTIIPLRSSRNKPKSTIVWMDTPEVINEASNLAKTEFNALITNKSMGIRGKMDLTGKKQKWPISSQITKALVSKRTVLIAESAHVMPPTGAQGLNTSVEDIICLYKICKKALRSNKDIGADKVLRQYSLVRLPLTGGKVFGIHLLNKISMTENRFLKTARKNFLKYTNKSPALRRTLIKVGLG